ncbi:MAG: cytidylate kinase-like family protein [Desulfobacteraceae bacterium]|jgi:cytidylate kinase
MSTRKRSIEQIVEEQVRRWDYLRREPRVEKVQNLLITVSREPGSDGDAIANGIAESLGLDLFHQNVIHEMAHSAKVSNQLVQSLDEKGSNLLEDTIAALVQKRHLWPDEYLKHLLKVIGTIGNYGNAVIVGRGANFILSQPKTFRLRIIAPRKLRIQKYSELFNIPLDEAKRRILKTESDRRAFIRKYFHEEINDPANYDLILNTGTFSTVTAVSTISAILQQKD